MFQLAGMHTLKIICPLCMRNPANLQATVCQFLPANATWMLRP